MKVKKIASQLSEIEQKTLKALSNSKQSFEDIAKKSGLQFDSLRRALQWLAQKKLIELSTTKKEVFELTDRTKKPLPERRLLSTVKKGVELAILREESKLEPQEFNIALGKLKRNNFISISTGVVSLTAVGEEFSKEKFLEEIVLEKISSNAELNEKEKSVLEDLTKRGLAKKVEKNFFSAKLNASGEQAKKIIEKGIKRTYNIFDPTPKIFIGKKQPYMQFLNQIRKTLVRIGFKEMPERLIVQEFYNFDVLFQPQNHPARSWTDTYQLKQPTMGGLPDKKKVAAVARAHENGGVSNSKGWGYKWNPKIAARLMPTSHGTTADALQMVEGVESPGKYFVINRCYRPDVLDTTHLVEFNQLDGFIVGEKINFRHLLGILKELAVEITGAKEVKFATGYFPFTEPSCELYIKDRKLGWVEVGGAGIFRPEITLPLGIKDPVIAWGLGIDRLAMIKLGVKDIRDLFSQDLGWLRNRSSI